MVPTVTSISGATGHVTAHQIIRRTNRGTRQENWKVNEGGIMEMQKTLYVRGPIIPLNNDFRGNSGSLGDYHKA